MNTTRHNPKPSCNTECGRRSFIMKSVYGTLGIGILASINTPAYASVAGTKKTKEEIFKQLDDLIDKYFPLYGTCSQASCAALTETFNIEADKVVKALAPFPGIALRGETCGAVSGCIASIALVYEDGQENQRASLAPSNTFCSKFEDIYGSTRCNDILEGMTNRELNLSKPEDYEAFHLIIFHINLNNPLNVGDIVTAGQELGKSQKIFGTSTDLAVGVHTPNGYKLVSYFDVMTDLLFQDYQARGMGSRDEAIISKEERDADPLTCDGEEFVDSGNLENWVTLN